MIKKKLIRAVSLAVCGAICASCLPALAGCKGKKDSILLMTEELSGLFNPFYATSAPDQDVVGMTQMGMLSTNNQGEPEAGDDLPTVVKAFDYETVNAGTENSKTTYKFVIKNGLKFSDGKPLTMNDVMFNIYEYLDPVYTGSSTMYSIAIEGLKQYRTQTLYSGEGSNEAEKLIADNALMYARQRRNELRDLYETKARQGASTSTSFSATEEEMKGYINEYADFTNGFKNAVSTTKDQQEGEFSTEDYRKILLEDYELTLKTFKEELVSDFKAAKESYDLTTPPYAEWKSKLENDVFKFFLYEGVITPVYEKNQGKDNKQKIEKFDGEQVLEMYSTEEKAIEKVYNDNVKTNLNGILDNWGTSGTLLTKYTADATEIQIKNNIKTEGMAVPNISGVVSLGHTTQVAKVEIKGVEYAVAHDHNEAGEPTNPNEYDVLQITINGEDPKAIYNFGFSVSPAHYYTADAEHPNGREIDIANNKFGVEYGSSSFQSRVIQSEQHVSIPVGAGPYQATNKDNNDNPSGSEFWSSNIVYYKANPNFLFPVKTDKVRMQVTSSANALDALRSGAVDYIVPQFTKNNFDILTGMESDGFKKLESWQLGYGYIGINAGKVPNINIRKAIMAAMQASLATGYYATGTCEVINWPMSNVSWAYPWADKANRKAKANGKDYLQCWANGNRENVKSVIKKYMGLAGVSAGSKELQITFTIAGASITEHPTYEVFKQAADILNSKELGWNVEVKADSQALTKLSTGSLAVWAAAWGSTIDPDMYQVYHKNSYATSVYAWGYREIKLAPATYPEETRIINELSTLIDQGRAITDQSVRKGIYEAAMGKVLDLAVEMPVYQRKNLYAYNANNVKGFPEEVNEYSSPLEKVWELELVK